MHDTTGCLPMSGARESRRSGIRATPASLIQPSRRARVGLCLLLLAPAIGHCWGPAGHRIVGALADSQLDDSSRAEIRRLLATSGDSSLADVANWADDVRDDPASSVLARKTARMHYINFRDEKCRFDAEADCAGGQCVVAAIVNYRQVLGDRQRPDSERAEALRFLVHFVGDVHQPLHAGYRPDKGGNTYQVRINGQGSNLHSVWDSNVLGSRGLQWQDYAQELLAKSPLEASGDAQAWAEQSCRVTRDAGVYPRRRTIDSGYLAGQRATAELQLRRAGSRLANLLNQALD